MKHNALVLCSGGPDCIVAGAILKAEGMEITLLHYQYGQKAAVQEQVAVANCAAAMNVPFITIETNAFAPIRSGILRDDVRHGAQLAGQCAFVPARNLILLSLAAGLAEMNGFGYLVLGNIADGRYPDNKPIFAERFDAILPHALSEGVTVRCVAPVNIYTKTQVIQIGLELKAPLHLTWSCYEAGALHCGRCASCQGRRQAFAANGVRDPLNYQA